MKFTRKAVIVLCISAVAAVGAIGGLAKPVTGASTYFPGGIHHEGTP